MSRTEAARGDQTAVIGNAVRESTARARHEETTTQQRHCSGKGHAHHKSGKRRSTAIARRRGTTAKTPARGLGGRHADAVTEAPQTTAVLTSTHGRHPHALHRRGSGARSRPGQQNQASPARLARGRQSASGLQSTESNTRAYHTGAAERKRIAHSARPGRRSAEVVYQGVSWTPG